MATSAKALNDKLRETYLEVLMDFFEKKGEEILRTGTNEFCFPCVDSEQNDKFIQVVVKVPTGSRDGEPFDGYSLAEDFQMKQETKAAKKKEDSERKAKKIERDKRLREEKKRLAEERKAREKGEQISPFFNQMYYI